MPRSPSDPADIDAAVASARRGFKQWSQATPATRGNVLLKLADLLERNREELAQIETCQSGKIIQISRAFEVDQGRSLSALLRWLGDQDQRPNHHPVTGPIATFFPYDTEEELLELMNCTPYGLSASLWSNDLSKALRMVPAIEAGTVWVNMHTMLDSAVPFGGNKSSGGDASLAVPLLMTTPSSSR